MTVPTPRVLVVIPTYNEAANLAWIVGRLRASRPEADVLIVDDLSPDGTGEIADGLAAEDDGIRVMHREKKGGLGGAYVAGFQWGLENGYDVLVEMDADGSHQPEELPRLLDSLDAADMVIGTRWMRGGAVINWPVQRQLLSRGGNLYVAALLGLGLHDATSGFRAYRRAILEKIDVSTIESTGYVFQIEMASRVLAAGGVVAEAPIEFIDRVRGSSKMDADIIRESMTKVTVWGLGMRRQQLRDAVKRLRRRLSS